MFKELLNLFGHHEGFEGLHSSFMATFEGARDIFRIAHEAVWKGDASEETGRRIYDGDILVNQREREVRKRVVRHLSVQQGLDIIYCLRLMSLVKDVERIGDYAKNLFEIGHIKTAEFDDVPLKAELRARADEGAEYIGRAVAIFGRADEKAALQAVPEGRALAKTLERLVEEAARHQGSPNTAACFVLMARHYKRSVSHACNVLTGLTMPIHKLDYHDEDEIEVD